MIIDRSARLFLTHTLLLVSGGVAGLVLAIYLSTLPWDFSADLERARQLGIVSKTVMSGYPKKRDLLTFVLAFVLPAAGALAAWLPWGFRRRKLIYRALYRDRAEQGNAWPAHRFRPYVMALSALLLVAGFFVLNRFYSSSFNEYNGAWPFLGEEGEFLEWCQRILNGEVQGRDFFCLYGPLMVYPLALLQKLAGPLVSLGRWYAFALNIVAYLLLAFIINRTIRSSTIAFITLLFMVAVFPYTFYSANLSPLRYIMGVWPLIPLLRHHSERSERLLALAGGMAGLSFLFSQEVGICAVIAASSFLMIDAFQRHDLRVLPRRFLLLFTGFTLVLAPFVLYFLSKEALGPLLENIVSYPRLVMLGYGGLAFPSLTDLVENTFAPLVCDNYWLIFVYVVAICLVAVRITTGRIDSRTFAACYVALFGVLLFRSALARSSVDKAYMISLPMFLLMSIALDNYLPVLKRTRTIFVKTVVCGSMFVCLLFMTQLSFLVPPLEELRKNFLGKDRFVFSPFGAKAFGVERDDVLHPPGTAAEIRLIADFFGRHESGKYVYFFPNEPAYYFLFDKMNPTRYPMSSLMVTSAMRQEAVADLERRKPEFVVYSTETWRPDDIPERVQTPEVYEYLESSYDVMEDHGAVVFLRRKQGR